jgi:hypothetical protein
MNEPSAVKVSSRWRRWPEAALTLLAATVIVFRLPPSALANLLRRHAANPAASNLPGCEAEAVAVGRTVARLCGRLPRRPRCLAQAVTVHLMLRRRAISHVIHFGVRKHEDRLEAHAWVSVGERIVVGEAGVPTFQPIASYGDKAS